ncbi:universal stress protein [Streptomyces sp. ME01-24h]|nr:universal stress protein [Streptomyces sp. ME19-03-3]MDX3352807.1 universal stress protein [Streptomyces sp. ME01-24h]
MFRRILVAVDTSGTDHPSVLAATELAALAGASVRVLHVDPSDVVYDTVVGREDDATAHKVLDDALATVRRHGVQAEGQLVDALLPDVAQAIADAARRYDADLIVLAPHPRTRLGARFSPRITDAVVHNSRIAVLLVPGNE